MHLFKSQWLQEAERRSFGPYREQGFDLRYARRRSPRRTPNDDRDIAASNDDVAIDDDATIAAAREILRRMADYDQAA